MLWGLVLRSGCVRLPMSQGALVGTAALTRMYAPLTPQVAAITAHKYSPDRYMYREGMKLAARYKAEEEALKAELKVREQGGCEGMQSGQHAPCRTSREITDVY